jgi:CBS domain containing-hemolysin-like protein
MNLLVLVVVASTVLSGYFGLTGFALRTRRRARLEEAFAGPSGRKRLAVLERHLRALQLTASFCRSVANLVLVVAMLYLVDPQHQGVLRALCATGLAGLIIAIFGVGIPHAWASQAGEKVLAATLWAMMMFLYLFYPIVASMRWLEVPIGRLAGAEGPVEQADEAAKQEILEAASEGQAAGAVDAEEVAMIASVMEFGGRRAGEIMTPRTEVFALPVEMSFQQVARRVVDGGHSRVPVYEGDMDNIVGILYAKDLLVIQDRAETSDLRGIMRKPFFVPGTKPLDDLLREFKSRQTHIAVVLDEYGGTAGLVTVEDVLEEIVGDIADEYDQPPPTMMKRLDERTAEADGRMSIDDLAGAMGLEIPPERDYDTVAGLIFSQLGYIPAAGEKLPAYGAEFTVLAADERRITKVRVSLLGKEGRPS